ncbi:MAG: hypothetical protein ACRERU_15665 [Methylococcales bacterium]
MKLLTKPTIAFLATFVVFSFATSSAHATLMLRLSSPSQATQTFTDNAGIDNLSQTGALGISTSIGNFFINVLTGLSYPTIGSQQFPNLDLNSVNVTSISGGGSITLELTDTGFTNSGILNLLTTIGGTTQGSISWKTYADTSNTAFGQATLIAMGSSNGPGVNGSNNFVFNPGGSFSLTHVITVAHSALKVTSFDIITEVPEPAPLALLSLGLFIIGSYRLKTQV